MDICAETGRTVLAATSDWPLHAIPASRVLADAGPASGTKCDENRIKPKIANLSEIDPKRVAVFSTGGMRQDSDIVFADLPKLLAHQDRAPRWLRFTRICPGPPPGT